MSDSLRRSVAAMRQEYGIGQLSRSDLDASPIRQFEHWFVQATAADVREPNAMTLATVGEDGVPNARTVLLKDCDDLGLTFFTNYESRKGRELATRPAAALLFFWKELERQVHFRGPVERITSQESEAYFFSRPYESRIGAWASHQSREIPDRAWLETRSQEYRERFPDTGAPDAVPLPDFWGGYRLVPLTVEFWQGQLSRQHDRFLYRRQGENWTIQRLSP
jgi:pyridoxamine 5'-phosphate oxidase